VSKNSQDVSIVVEAPDDQEEDQEFNKSMQSQALTDENRESMSSYISS